MNVIIAGAGEVGYYTARSLYSEGWEVAIIESNPEAADRAEGLDALVVRGNAASVTKLEEAGIKEAQTFIAVTASDETNMVACSIAKGYGVNTIARINHSDYIDRPVSTDRLRLLGVDVAICPDLVSAHKIVRILMEPPALLEADVFAKGRIKVVQVTPGEKSPALRVPIRDIAWPRGANLAAIFRKGEVIVPRGPDTILEGDRVVILGDDASIRDMQKMLAIPVRRGSEEEPIQKVMVGGATRIGINIAKLLEPNVSVTLFEPNQARAEEASSQLGSTLVIQAEPTDRDVLFDEGIGTVDAFIGATELQGKNILSCLLAKRLGAGSTIALIDQIELVDLLHNVGVDLATSPRIATVNTLLQYTHRSEDLVSLAVMQQGEARVLEMVVTPSSKIGGRTLKRANLPQNTLVAAMVRGEETIIPHGDTMVEVGDTLVIFARTEAIPRLKKLI